MTASTWLKGPGMDDGLGGVQVATCVIHFRTLARVFEPEPEPLSEVKKVTFL